MLDFLRLSEEEEVISEQQELLSVQEGVERPEESRGSQFKFSSDLPLVSWVLWLCTLELGEMGL